MRRIVHCGSLLLLVSTASCGQDLGQSSPSAHDTGAGGGANVSDASGGASGSGGAIQSGIGGGASPGGSGGGSVSGVGGTDGSSGGAASGGAAATDEEIEALLSEFAAYWDFETVAAEGAVDRVGGATLGLEGATVSPGAQGDELVVSGPGTTAATTDPLVDTSTDFSISTWVKLDELDGYDTFVGIDGQEVSAFFLQKRDDDRLSFATFSSDATSTSACVTTAEIQPRAGEWYHVVGSFDAGSSEQRIYVDGVLSGKQTCAGGVFKAQGGLSVGRGLYDGAATDPWSGAVDDLGLIQRVLTPKEVVSLYRYGRPDQKNYLFSYFIEVTEGRGDGLRLAHSHDGLHWGAIGANRVFMPASVGGGSFRDPHLMRTPDGLYHLSWTTSCVPWAEANCIQDRGLGHATSLDLVQWSEADYITIDLEVEHVWAPETIYDTASEQTMVFWSSPLDQNASASDPHDIYYILTKDFQSFTDPEVLYTRPGRNFIDATILDRGDGYLMIIKDEADGQKNLRALSSPLLFGEGAWTADPSAPLTGSYAAEGPSFLQRDGQLFVYFDKYGEGAYGALRATSESDLEAPVSWQDISSQVFFPGVRHGTPIEVPWDVFEAVAIEAGR